MGKKLFLPKKWIVEINILTGVQLKISDVQDAVLQHFWKFYINRKPHFGMNFG